MKILMQRWIILFTESKKKKNEDQIHFKIECFNSNTWMFQCEKLKWAKNVVYSN